MSIEVHVRVRPNVGGCVWSSAETVLYSTSDPTTRYVHNKVHPSTNTNRHVFLGLEAVIHAGFNGKNVTIMAYGQTGSGKTHSMIGNADDYGVVPRAARLLLALRQQNPGTTISAYYTEIYNEAVKDLLEPRRGELVLHDAADGGVFYDKRVVELNSFEDFMKLQSVAEVNRRYGVTDLNDHSSRSHVILTFEVHRPNQVGSSVINLVDLAGSESASRANTGGLILREGGFINRSLLTLGNVVDAIVERRPYVPYRDAKLTRLLRTCLGGTGITIILCCVNPSKENYNQTVSTLRFTQRAMKLKKDPVVVLNLPPLFTHQYSAGAALLAQGLQESADEEYQRGLRDAYMYCTTTTASVVGTHESQVADAMHILANAQRLLVAHDHALAIDRLGRLYSRLGEATRVKEANQQRVGDERKRQREVTVETAHRRSKLARLEAAVQAPMAAADADLAGLEYRLHEARQRYVTEVEVLLATERVQRVRLQYERAVGLEQLAARFVPVLKVLLPGGEEQVIREASSAAAPAGAAGRPLKSAALVEMRTQLAHARLQLHDLVLAHDMVRDDLAALKASAPSTQPASPSTSPPPRPSRSEAQVMARYEHLNEADIERHIRRLERQERTLLAQAKRDVRRESLRQVRASMRGAGGSSASRSPQSRPLLPPETYARGAPSAGQPSARGASGSAATRDRLPLSSTVSPPPRREPIDDRHARAASPSHAGRYSAGVRNALSVLDDLKNRLLRSKHQTPSADHHRAAHGDAGASPLTPNVLDEAEGEAVLLPSTRRARSEKGRRAAQTTMSPPRDANTDDDVPLVELYKAQQQAEKENVPYRRRPDHAAAPSVPKYTVVDDDNDAFYINRGRVEHSPPPPPVRPAARRARDDGAGRPVAVERTLWQRKLNSQSPSRSSERGPS